MLLLNAYNNRKVRMVNCAFRSSLSFVGQFHVRFFSKVGLIVETQNAAILSSEGPQYDATSYYFENGLRKVYPYHFTYNSYAKSRWVGQKLVELYTNEFRARPVAEYERFLRTGRFRVNGGPVELDHIIKHNDLLSNTIHRHEMPVTAAPIRIVHKDADTLVVDKPSSIPIHPCGRYCHNTVTFILAKEHDMKHIMPLHRIDRLTSGLVLFGRSHHMTRLIHDQLRKRQVEKVYVCRVQGHFPQGPIECHEPIDRVSRKISVSKVSPAGKPCSTQFKLLSCSGASSVVLCRPRTGRTHQIRVHLQYLGYPILNDPVYNNTAFGPNKGKGGVTEVTDEQLVKSLMDENYPSEEGQEHTMLAGQGSEHEDLHRGGVVSCPASPQQLPGTNSDVCRDEYGFKPHLKTVDEDCYECKLKSWDPNPKDLIMFLHAFKYSAPGWEFETKMPDWTAPDWVDTEDGHALD